MKKKPIKPTTSFEFIEGWFEKAAKNAKAQGRVDSSALWDDGLEHLRHIKSQRDELLEACKNAYCQIEYLHTKFGKTGSGEQALVMLDTAIAKAERK